MPYRVPLAGLCLLLLALGPVRAEPNVPTAARRWIAGVVTRVGEVERTAAASRGPAVAVEIRLRIAADGSLRDAVVERSSGSADLDARAIAAARLAAPFGRPPRTLLTGDGITELTFPVEVAGTR